MCIRDSVLIIDQILDYSQVTSTLSGSASGYSWTMVPVDFGDRAVVAGWTDQKFQVTLNIPAGLTNLTLKIDSTLNQAASDESWAIDNFDIGSGVNGSSTLTAVNEDTASPAGATVTSLLSGNFSDVTDTVTSGSTANTLAGVAITGYTADAAQGEWQYTSDGSTWSAISSVAGASGALTFAAADLLRFVPALNFNGAAPTLTVILIESPTVVTTNATVDVSVLSLIHI